jgi:hypothetical protein
MIRATDGAAGAKTHCPFCGVELTVPTRPEVVEDLGLGKKAAGAAPPRPGIVRRRSATIVADTATCDNCHMMYPRNALFCPYCGHKNKHWKDPAKQAVGLAQADIQIDRMMTGCWGAGAYAARHLKSLLALSACMLAPLAALRLLLLPDLPLMVMAGLAPLAGVAAVLLMGYAFIYYLDVLATSVEMDERRPRLPAFKVKDLLAAGIIALGMLIVYVVPIITLPLMPLGVLAVAHERDGRAYDLHWAAQSASRHRRPLGVLWGVLIIASAIFIAIGVGLGFPLHWACQAAGNAGGVALGLVVEIAAMGILLVLASMMLCVQARCIGMFTAHNPSLAEGLPEVSSPLATVASLGVGLAGSVASAKWVIPAVAAWVRQMLGI